MKPGLTGWQRLHHAAGYSWAGFKAAWRDEAAFRQELVLGAVALLLSLMLSLSLVERALLVASTLLVLLVELLNSGIEAAIDRISPEPHPLSKKAKDLGSAAVLISLLLWLLCWVMVIGRNLAN